TLFWQVDDNGPIDAASIRRVSDFVTAQLGRMPDYLRLPMLALTLLCDGVPVMSKARGRFHKLPVAARNEVVSKWRTSRLSPLRDWVRFYESLIVFGCVAEREDTSTRLTVS